MVFKKGKDNIAKQLKIRQKISKALKDKPFSDKHKQNMKKNHWSTKGYSSWNKGLTKENDERIKQYGLKNSIARKKLIKEGLIIPSSSCFQKGHIPHNKNKTKENYLPLQKISENKERAEKIRLARIEEWKDNKFREERLKKIFSGLKTKPTNPETELFNIIKENNFPFNYVGNGQIVIGGFNPDFLSKNPKNIIEMFGDYWHNRSEVKKRDIRKLDVYKKYGYKTLIIWEKELNNKQQVIQKIQEFIK